MRPLSTYFRFCNVSCQNVAFFVLCIVYVTRFEDKNKIESVISPYIYKLNAINPELSKIQVKDQGEDKAPKWQSYKFQALAESGCLDQYYYNKTTMESTFKDITSDTSLWTGGGGNTELSNLLQNSTNITLNTSIWTGSNNNTDGSNNNTELSNLLQNRRNSELSNLLQNPTNSELSNLLQNPTNWDKQNEHIVCKCINDITLTDEDAGNFYETHQKFKDEIKNTCHDDNKIPIYFVESFENVDGENIDRHFSRFMLGIFLLMFYAWSLSAKSWTDAVLFREENINATLEVCGIICIFFAIPLSISVCMGFLLDRCISDIPDRLLWNADAFDQLILSLAIIAFAFIAFSWGGLALVMYSIGANEGTSANIISFRSSANLRTIMDYSFVLGGTITLVYASIMSGISSLASICTLFILAISIFYSIHVNFYMRNQLDYIMSNLDETTSGHIFNTGGKNLDSDKVETIEVGLRPFANSIVMTRLTYLMFTFTLLISIVFMARDTPVASESYILSYQVNWIVLVFLTLCTFSYDFFNEVQQKIIKYTDHDLIVYAVIFISSHVLYIVK